MTRTVRPENPELFCERGLKREKTEREVKGKRRKSALGAAQIGRDGKRRKEKRRRKSAGGKGGKKREETRQRRRLFRGRFDPRPPGQSAIRAPGDTAGTTTGSNPGNGVSQPVWPKDQIARNAVAQRIKRNFAWVRRDTQPIPPRHRARPRQIGIETAQTGSVAHRTSAHGVPLRPPHQDCATKTGVLHADPRVHGGRRNQIGRARPRFRQSSCDTLRLAQRVVAKVIGMKRLSAHDLRRSFVTLACANDAVRNSPRGKGDSRLPRGGVVPATRPSGNRRTLNHRNRQRGLATFRSRRCRHPRYGAGVLSPGGN